ncbi:glycine betaine/L-proline ABC transporter ATP-binding protein [Chloroflexota bacterium]
MNSAGALLNDDISVEVNGLWKIFGPDARQLLNSELRSAPKGTIHKETGCMVAIRNVSFVVNRGEFLIIMGAADSGKSTLIRCILRLIEPTTGEIIIKGENICNYKNKQLIQLRRNITGMIFKHAGLFHHHNVIENVAYGLKVKGIPGDERYTRAQEVINQVGLKGWENRFPGSLSESMQQRVGIARALANDPEILLMDDPFSGLDPLVRRQMQDELLDIQSKVNKTILFTTPDINEALKLGGHIAVIKDGELIQIGTPEEVITSPSHDYVRKFVQDTSPAKVVTASSIMEQPHVLLYEWQGPKAAMHILRTNNLNEAFLVNRTGELLGMLTVERLVKLFRRKGNSLTEALESEAFTCTANTIIEDLFPLVASTGYPIAVIDKHGKFLGEINASTILVSMIQEKEVETEPTESGKEQDKVTEEEIKSGD